MRVLIAPDKPSYFNQFNRWLRDTDILWTKPSELVFYCALGIPILLFGIWLGVTTLRERRGADRTGDS